MLSRWTTDNLAHKLFPKDLHFSTWSVFSCSNLVGDYEIMLFVPLASVYTDAHFKLGTYTVTLATAFG